MRRTAVSLYDILEDGGIVDGVCELINDEVC
jgi:hypothetical protein